MYANASKWLRSFFKKDTGVTAIEYGLIAALIAVVIIVSLTAVGVELGNVFNHWTNAVVDAVGSP